MAKRKNPLKDLDSFLKQEATSFVKPEGVTGETEAEGTPDQPVIIDKDKMLNYFTELAKKDPSAFRSVLLELAQKSVELTGAKTAQDKMLINTLLYLNNPENWETVIKEYWQ